MTRSAISLFMTYFLCFIFVFTVPNVFAVNMQFLKYSPVSDFSETDFELLQKTGVSAINNNDNGQASTWQNPETGHYGSIKPLDRKTIDNMPCRTVVIENHTKQRSGQSKFTFCKVDNKWKVLK